MSLVRQTFLLICVHDEKGGQKNSVPTLYEMTAACQDSETW